MGLLHSVEQIIIFYDLEELFLYKPANSCLAVCIALIVGYNNLESKYCYLKLRMKKMRLGLDLSLKPSLRFFSYTVFRNVEKIYVRTHIMIGNLESISFPFGPSPFIQVTI